MSYVSHLDGIRALAILLVIAFHYFPEHFRGGFIGVDLFFVLSGFLITRIYSRKILEGNFSFLDFYIRRVKRILPPIIILIFFSSVIGGVIFTNSALESYSKSAVASTLLFANFHFYFTSGYFDVSAIYKPLLHMWSLAIEEQFYVVWPMILVLSLAKFKNKNVIYIVTLGSLVSSAYLSIVNPTGAYFLPQSRFWELGVGGIIAFHENKIRAFIQKTTSKIYIFKNTLGIIVFSLLVLSGFFVSKESYFPFPFALIPILCGTYFLVYGGQEAFLERVLNYRIIRNIGLISYSLYIWHWTLLSFYVNLLSRYPSFIAKLFLILLSFFFSHITYHYIELPFKKLKSPVRLRWAITGLVIVTLSLGLINTHRSVLNFVRRNTVPLINQISMIDTGYKNLNSAIKNILLVRNIRELIAQKPPHLAAKQTSCVEYGLDRSIRKFCTVVGEPNKSKNLVFVWGDSIAHMWRTTLTEISILKNATFIFVTHAGCPPILGVKRIGPNIASDYCNDGSLQPKIIEFWKKMKPTHTLLIARWNLYVNGHYADGKLVGNSFIYKLENDGNYSTPYSRNAFQEQLKKTADVLADSSKVIIFKDNPLLDVPIVEGIARNSRYYPSLSEHYDFEKFVNEQIKKIEQNNPSVDSFNLSHKLCRKYCEPIINGLPIYLDNVHLSYFGTSLFKMDILKLLDI